jgi:transcriptional regulator of arginine metabolism
MMGRARRQQIIVEVLQRQPVESQEELRQALAGRGIEVTQATLSRDLRELGAIKTPRGYQLPQSRGHVGGEGLRSGGPLARTLASFVTAVEPAGNIVVLKTGPGHAQIVALELDRASLAGVVGCLAGDDTVFTAMVSMQRAKELSRELVQLAGLGLVDGVLR